jgi:hypothetical protein
MQAILWLLVCRAEFQDWKSSTLFCYRRLADKSATKGRTWKGRGRTVYSLQFSADKRSRFLSTQKLVGRDGTISETLGQKCRNLLERVVTCEFSLFR